MEGTTQTESAATATSDYSGFFRDRRVLVTGGLGFIGSRLCRRLATLGARPVVLDNLAPDTGGSAVHRAELADIAEIHVVDIRDEDLVARLVASQDVIFNLAALIGHGDSMRRPVEDLDVNARAQVTFLETCRRINPGVRIIHASTRQVYGRPQKLPVGEDHPLHPPDVNGVNKLAGEMFHLLYHQVYGLRTTVLRITNTYGPGMRVQDGRHTFIGLWFRAILEDEPIEVWGGQQIRDITFVEDVVDGFCTAATNERAIGEVFNIGGAESMTLRDLAEVLVEVAGRGSFRVIPYPAERLAIEIGSFISDVSKARQILGWTPRTSLRDGLRATLEFYRDKLPLYT